MGTIIKNEALEITVIVFACFGAISVLKFLYKFYHRFLKGIFGLNYVKKYGQGWCLVTGGTDGIGKAYCQELAKEGFNICVFGRSAEKALKVCNEIQEQNQGKIKAVPIIADFKDCLSDENFIKKIKEQIDSAIGSEKVSMLVNNVGVEKIGSIREKTQDWYKQIIAINVGAQTLMTKLVIDEYMKKGDYSGRKAIISVSSGIAEALAPNDADYCGSKIYNDRFSKSLSYELKKEKIDCLSVRPYFVSTPLTGNMTGFTTGVISPNSCAGQSLKSLGRVHSTNGATYHKFQAFMLSFYPEFLQIAVFPYIYKMLENAQQKAKKKQEQEQKIQPLLQEA